MVTRWAFSPGLEVGADTLAARGFEVSRQENFVVPGTMSVEDYLKGLAPKQRAAVRRGGQRGLTAGPSTRDEITRWLPWQLARAGRAARPGTAWPRRGSSRSGSRTTRGCSGAPSARPTGAPW